ncbi:MAG TPA: ATP-binding domain-containing protein [Solirubrobacteraceae bacterium]|nr:ATP-binding domain-containing protein [Solirubrobacteraceae bacterium]
MVQTARSEALEIIQGESRNRPAARSLADALRQIGISGTVYLGYPVIATADERVEIDALLVSSEHGVVAFLIADAAPESVEEWTQVTDIQDRMFTVLESSLSRHESLRAGRKLALVPRTATIFSAVPDEVRADSESFYGGLDALSAWLTSLPSLRGSVEKAVHAALQRVATIKPAKTRASVARPSSRGAKLKDIEKGIANLDSWQKRAAIESPEGPQRIRGLAGSGKTVVLALKAAYLHTQNPDWKIALTFHSRSLYQQVDDLITRFTFEHSNDRPNPRRLKILHSWGSRNRRGVYSSIAEALGEVPRDWTYASGKYGMDHAFQGVCRELLEIVDTRPFDPIFDAVLIDEAQDLPPEFFQLVYAATKEPKRIVWGYDELQKLSEVAMPTTDELFGLGPDGESLVSLDAVEGAPRRDIVLPVCYRNTPWALATAHALGIGVYREGGLLQHPDEPRLWKDIGYNVVHGRLVPGKSVTLKRAKESYPEYFPRLLESKDAIILESFMNEANQDEWVAEQISINLSNDELEYDDILIVLPDSYTAKSRAPKLIRALRRRQIPAHLVGVNSSVDEVFRSGSVAIAHIFRAKGNEAPMVYAVDAHRAAESFNEVTRRNTLFTAITRSRAWVRITGWGHQMPVIAREVEKTMSEEFKLRFVVPTISELEHLRHIHRERPREQEEAFRKASAGLSTFVEALEAGDLDVADIPAPMRARLEAVIDSRNGDG